MFMNRTLVVTDWSHICTLTPSLQQVWIQVGPEVYWGTPDNAAPPDEPPCGFNQERCPPDTTGDIELLWQTTPPII